MSMLNTVERKNESRAHTNKKNPLNFQMIYENFSHINKHIFSFETMFQYSVHISLCGNDACKNDVHSIKFHKNMCLLRQMNGSSVYHGTNRTNVVFKSIIPRLTKSSMTHKIRNTTTNFFSMLTLMCDRQFPQI